MNLSKSLFRFVDMKLSLQTNTAIDSSLRKNATHMIYDVRDSDWICQLSKRFLLKGLYKPVLGWNISKEQRDSDDDALRSHFFFEYIPKV